MRLCTWNGCTRTTSRQKDKLCEMHNGRKKRGQDMDAPGRYTAPRRLRKQRTEPYEVVRPRLFAALRERAHTADTLAAALGIGRTTVRPWLTRLMDDDDVYVEEFSVRHPNGGRPVTYFFIFTGKYPDNYPASYGEAA